MVSTIDDAERETRSWLKQCMETISGYPSFETTKIMVWDNSHRPNWTGEGYLVGYNEDTSAIELIGVNGAGQTDVKYTMTDDMRKEIALLAHPVGEYYWTSNTSFNPNTAWGGTWERIQDGRVLISDTLSHQVGSTGGSETVTLTLNQLPYYRHAHRHDRGTMNITGKTGGAGVNSSSPTADGAFYKYGTGLGVDDNDYDNQLIAFDASRSWTGETSEDEFEFGNDESHNNMQPYRVAVCWHRTA